MDNKDVPLFTPHKMGDVNLKNRIIVSSCTRQRANIADGIPTDEFAKYYAARSDAGFILTESIPISMESNGYIGAGCMYNDA